jgi:hypothetical protein
MRQPRVHSTPGGLTLHAVYRTAALVESSLDDDWALAEVDWDAPEVRLCLGRFCRTSLLKYYIWAVVRVCESTKYRELSCLSEENETEEAAKRIEYTLRAHRISHEPWKGFALRRGRSKGELPGEVLYAWFEAELDAFSEMWNRLTDEVFHILFGNRRFLLRFNESVARYLREADGCHDPARRAAIPSWVKKAVFARDVARCVLCRKDLSGIRSTDREAHYDHIVALNRGGINDPCNLQLLCGRCNRRKGRKAAVTSDAYPLWWDPEPESPAPASETEKGGQRTM